MSRKNEIISGESALSTLDSWREKTPLHHNNEAVDNTPIYVEARKKYVDTPRQRMRKIGATTVGILLGTGLVAGGGFAAYGMNIARDFTHVKTVAGVNGGKAVVENVNMDIQPITLSTAPTKVSGVKAELHQSVLGINFNGHTVTRSANVIDELTLSPGSVQIQYNDSTEALKFYVPNAALASKVYIPTGESKTTDESSSLTALPSAIVGDITKTIGNKFGNDQSTKVPLLGKVAAGNIDINNALAQISDFYTVKEVDQKCTPLITQIPGFITELKANVKESVKGRILDISGTATPSPAATGAATEIPAAAATTNPNLSKDLSALLNKPLSKVIQIVDNATVVMDNNFTVSPDKTNVQNYQNYVDSGLVSASMAGKSTFECAVSKNATLTRTTAGASH